MSAAMNFRIFRLRPGQAMPESVLAIGNFDGVHLGHRAVLYAAAEKARALGLPLSVLTFSPHPHAFFKPDQTPYMLFPLAERLRLLREAGVQQVFIQKFDRRLSEMSAQDFIQKLLIGQLRARHVFTGAGFAFGHKRGGNSALLAAELQAAGVGYTAMQAEEGQGTAISSTRVRHALREGDMETAASLLGRPYASVGIVRHGKKMGRELGYPTANISLSPRHLPREGVYTMRARMQGEMHWHDAIGSFGTRPTFNGENLLLEVHWLDARTPPDLYGKRVEVQWLHFQRGQVKYEGAEALRLQMDKDAEEARIWLRHHPIRGGVKMQEAKKEFCATRDARLLLASVAFAAILLADQLSKTAVLKAFYAGKLPLAVTSFFNLPLVWNRGVSFGMLANHPMGPLLLKGLAFVLMLVLLRWLWTAVYWLQALAIGMILGGALGNVVDRFRYGAVVDFLDFHWQGWHYPAFNIADSGICVGVVLLILESIFGPSAKRDATSPTPQETPHA